ANGKLIESRRDVLELSRRAAMNFGVSDEAAAAAATKLVSAQGAFFAVGDGDVAGTPVLDVPLVEAGALFGIVTIEEARQGVAREASTLVATLASLLGSSIKNARLQRAAMFFRDYLAQTLEHAS